MIIINLIILNICLRVYCMYVMYNQNSVACFDLACTRFDINRVDYNFLFIENNSKTILFRLQNYVQ